MLASLSFPLHLSVSVSLVYTGCFLLCFVDKICVEICHLPTVFFILQATTAHCLPMDRRDQENHTPWWGMALTSK